MARAVRSPRPNILWSAARIIVPWVGLVVVITVAWSLIADYRDAVDVVETTTTVESTSTAGIVAGEPYVMVLSDGLNLRIEPSTSSTVVKVLDEGQQLAFIEEGTGWYHVRDPAGVEGWVAAGGTYTQLVTP